MVLQRESSTWYVVIPVNDATSQITSFGYSHFLDEDSHGWRIMWLTKLMYFAASWRNVLRFGGSSAFRKRFAFILQIEITVWNQEESLPCWRFSPFACEDAASWNKWTGTWNLEFKIHFKDFFFERCIINKLLNL